MCQNYRTTDPITSKIAGDAVTTSGRRAVHLMKVVEMVGQFPGHTAAELASIADDGMDRYEYSRRLADAYNLNMVTRSDKDLRRVCHITHNLSMVWYPK